MKSSDSNWRPLSVEMDEGVPKRAIQPEMKAQAMVSAVICGIGMASGQCVKRSMQVSRYVYPLEGERGLTRSMWMWSKRMSGLAKVDRGVICRCTLER